jgi:hypothetical protein
MGRRTSVDIDPEIETTAKESPQDLGLPARMSASSVYREIMRVGFRTLREQHERAERIRIYQEWAQDEELRQSIRESANLAYDEGVL